MATGLGARTKGGSEESLRRVRGTAGGHAAEEMKITSVAGDT